MSALEQLLKEKNDFISTTMFPAWQLKQLELSFKTLDISGNGFITKQQVTQLLGQQVVLGRNARTPQDILHQMNKYHMENVDFITFVILIEEAMEREVNHQRLQRTSNKNMKMLDTLNEGIVTTSLHKSVVSTTPSIKESTDETICLEESQNKTDNEIKYKHSSERKASMDRLENLFTVSEIHRYKDAFCQFDVNDDGVISRSELERLLRVFGVHLSKQTVHNMIAEVDVDDKGFVDYAEFLTFLSVHMDEQTDFEKMVNQEFRKYDVNGEGVVTVSELRDVLRRYCVTMTTGEVDEVLYESNLKDSDQVNYKQYFTRRL